MGGLFSSPKAATPPGPDPALLKRQQEQEDRLNRQERSRQAEISARRRARSGSGNRQLIFQTRTDPAIGVPTNTTLGTGNRNPDRENL
jgi:hypothetical protein